MKTVNLPDITFVWKNQLGNCEKFLLHRFSTHARCERVIQYIPEKNKSKPDHFAEGSESKSSLQVDKLGVSLD